ncbi:hypothetical protein B0H63DRAFT_32249 [Podospora didyma]|uniref:Uncharacterized protein n=1 Tax=Podospora didyma TaxID=330526 RepID=A0AAE0U817_9PEZI|nr:hypothetical protein B0H63DRAFT_32249 [Podospora didyma]
MAGLLTSVNRLGGDCDPTTARCCGQNNYFPVYINPELQGCYSPVIPGYKNTSTQTTFDFNDIDASYLGPPKALAQRVYSSPLASTPCPHSITWYLSLVRLGRITSMAAIRRHP